MKPLFCNTAKHYIRIPRYLLTGNIKVEKGITIKCGVPGCKGKVNFKPEVKEEIEGTKGLIEEQNENI